jgi:RNA polymerase sigma-70 factor, ECF subfamily
VVADREGFEAFYREHLDRVVRACALVVLDSGAAEDFAAEAFARLWSNWGQVHDSDHAGGYVFKTAMRLCAKRGADARREPVGVQGDRPAPGDEAERATVRHDVWEALAGLSLRQRQTLVLRDWAGYSTNEVAAMLGIAEPTVRVHLTRGREQLRQVLKVQERG